MHATIDLATAPFWIVVGVGILLLSPITHAAARRWLLAALNLGFLATLLHEQVIYIALGLAIAFVMLKAVALPRWRVWMWLAAGLLTMGLFFLNKIAGLSTALHIQAVNPLLAAVSFSYVALRIVEVFRNVGEGRQPAPDFPSVVNYLVPFHMLAAGPIQSYDEFAAQPSVPPPPTPRYALYGLQRIAGGVFKKYVLAYIIHEIFLTQFRAMGMSATSNLYWFIEVQLFYIWIYLDFTAYSDIAVGIGILLGVATPENFNKPYMARNMIDFWERWHITLSHFIRRNVFFPIQMAAMRKTGGRFPRWIASASFTLSFLLCGIWHQVSTPYFIWGALHAGGLVAANLYRLWLTRRFGAKGVKIYLENRIYHAIACIVTFEWVALTMFIVGKDWQY